MMVIGKDARLQVGRTVEQPFDGWLISFADLLTLLLCFIISLVVLSPLNPNVVALTDRYLEIGSSQAGHFQEIYSQRRAGSQDGTEFAVTGSGHSFGWSFSRELILADEEDQKGMRLQPDASARLEKALSSGGCALSVAKVSICNSYQYNAAKDSAIPSVVAIYRQLIDTGIPPKKISVSMNTDCRELQSLQSDGREIVALVDFAFNRNS